MPEAEARLRLGRTAHNVPELKLGPTYNGDVRSPARRATRHPTTPPEPRVHRGGRVDARAQHRGHQRDLHGGRCGDPAAPAVQGRGATGARHVRVPAARACRTPASPPPSSSTIATGAACSRQITGVWPITANLTGSSKPERVETVLAGPEYFQMLGARPQAGTPLWTAGLYARHLTRRRHQRRALEDEASVPTRSVIGRTLRIDDDPYEIIGVTTPDFRHPSLTLETEAEIWAPTGWIAPPFDEPRHSRRFLPAAIGRLKPGSHYRGRAGAARRLRRRAAAGPIPTTIPSASAGRRGSCR